MYVVTTHLTARADEVDALKTAVVRLAAETLESDPAAHSYDVCFDPEDDLSVFLYQVFETPEDYLAHLDTPAAQAFAAQAEAMVAERRDHTWRRL